MYIINWNFLEKQLRDVAVHNAILWNNYCKIYENLANYLQPQAIQQKIQGPRRKMSTFYDPYKVAGPLFLGRGRPVLFDVTVFRIRYTKYVWIIKKRLGRNPTTEVHEPNTG